MLVCSLAKGVTCMPVTKVFGEYTKSHTEGKGTEERHLLVVCLGHFHGRPAHSRPLQSPGEREKVERYMHMRGHKGAQSTEVTGDTEVPGDTREPARTLMHRSIEICRQTNQVHAGS